MRILHILAPAPFGGLERVVQSLAVEQSRAGHEVHVAAILDPGNPGHAMLGGLADGNVTTHVIAVPPRGYLQERRRVRALCMSIAAQVIHTHGYRPDVLHRGVARQCGIPAVTTVHGFTGGNLTNRVYEALQRRSYRRFDAVAAVSRPMFSQLRESGVPEDRLHLVPNAWADPGAFLSRSAARHRLGIPGDEACIGFIGRISHEKGPDVFLAAIRELSAPVRGVLIGDGTMREQLASSPAAPGITISWPGVVQDAGRLVKAFDMVVLSSRTEGTPMVLLEAMAGEVPIVTTRVGGIPDVVSEREAFLVPPEDPVALTAAMRAVLASPETARARAAQALQRLHSEFNAVLWRERYDEIYEAARVKSGGGREALRQDSIQS